MKTTLLLNVVMQALEVGVAQNFGALACAFLFFTNQHTYSHTPHTQSYV